MRSLMPQSEVLPCSPNGGWGLGGEERDAGTSRETETMEVGRDRKREEKETLSAAASLAYLAFFSPWDLSFAFGSLGWRKPAFYRLAEFVKSCVVGSSPLPPSPPLLFILLQTL